VRKPGSNTVTSAGPAVLSDQETSTPDRTG